MDRTEFANKMANQTINLTDEERADIFGTSLMRNSRETKLVVAMEELAELQQELSKCLRGEEDIYALTEEAADAVICLCYVLYLERITAKDLFKAVDIKLLREKERLESCTED